MAAYAALVSLMNDLELIPNHPTHSFSFDNKQITSLSQTVHFLIDFIESYDTHECSREAAEVLESRIASTAHAAHDVIESHVVDQIHEGSTLGGEATSCFLPDLQKAIDDMDFVKGKTMHVKSKRRLKAEEPTNSSESLTSGKNVMVGFEADALRLMDMFIGGSPRQRVIPIVGMGGIGKTTLAKYVYERLFIKQHFDVRLWATISQDYSAGNILDQLLSGKRKSTTGGDASELGEELHKMLCGRRYLIVLDDMWSERAWHNIRIFLPDDGTGSCVIVTTRLSNLAAQLSSSPFEMKLLDDDKSWELFCGKAFGEEDCPIELEEIGKKIVQRCRGLPLSIVVIGSHLRRYCRAIEHWEKVANTYMNPISSIGADDECLKIISLSYEHLPPCLKPCFLYMGIFREDEWIDASKLLEYWVAEGFLKPKKGLSLEEVAEEYLKDLIDRNLIFAGKKRWDGKVARCGIHDIVRELCLKVGEREKFMCYAVDSHDTIGCREKNRRIVIPPGKKLDYNVICALKSAPLLRSLMCQLGQIDYNELRVELRLLRVSDYINNEVLKKDGRDFPAANMQQVNLRYLAFSSIDYSAATTMSYNNTETLNLPSSISLFWNMQTLIMKNEFVTISAPYEIWGMPQLRNLQFTRGCLVDPAPPNQGECIVLRNLHTLVGVENLRLTEEVCRRMPNLKKLSLSYDDFPGVDYSYYCLHNLGRFNKLESLECHFGADPEWCDIGRSFTFPTSLQHLSLCNRSLHWEGLTMTKYLPHLRSLELNFVRGPEWDLGEEEFPCLKILKINLCHDLTHWNNVDMSRFPVLEHLDIRQVPKLSEIPFDIGEIPTLRLIQVIGSSASAAVSAVRIVVQQESLGNYNLQLVVGHRSVEEVERFEVMVEEEDLTTIYATGMIRLIRPSEMLHWDNEND